MSGTNRLVMSSVVGSKGSETTLTKSLQNANEVALKSNKQAPKTNKTQKSKK